MKERPLIFVFLSLFFFGVSIALPIQIAALYDHDMTSFEAWQSIAMKLTPLNWLVMLSCLVAAFLSFKVHPFLKWWLPSCILFVSINNFIVGLWAVDYSMVTTSLSSIGFFCVSYSFAFTYGHQTLTDTSKHWWKIPKRVKRDYPCWIETGRKTGKKKRMLARTFDISKSGAFICAIGKERSIVEKLQEQVEGHDLGQRVKILLGTDSGEVEIDAEIVRIAESKRGGYPVGMGLQFQDISWRDRIKLSRILNSPQTVI